MYYKIIILSHALLVCLLVSWYGIFNPPQSLPAIILTIIYVGVLLLPARALWQKRQSVFLWSSYLILIYFSHGIIEGWANDHDRTWAIGELILSGIYFAGATMCYRDSRKKSSATTG